MSDLKKDDETPEVAEIAPFEPDQGTDTLYTPPARLKEYFTSPNASSRYLMALSTLFAFLAVVCFSLLILHYWKHRHHVQKSSETVIETLRVEPTFHQSLGEFRVQWDQSEMRATLSAECSTEAACSNLKEKYAEVHDLILPVFQGSSEQNVTSPEHKQHLREELIEKLNELKLPGRVLQIDFTDLTIEPHKT